MVSIYRRRFAMDVWRPSQEVWQTRLFGLTVLRHGQSTSL